MSVLGGCTLEQMGTGTAGGREVSVQHSPRPGVALPPVIRKRLKARRPLPES